MKQSKVFSTCFFLLAVAVFAFVVVNAQTVVRPNPPVLSIAE